MYIYTQKKTKTPNFSIYYKPLRVGLDRDTGQLLTHPGAKVSWIHEAKWKKLQKEMYTPEDYPPEV